MVYPKELVAMIKSGINPQQLTLNILKNQMSNTPMGQNLLSLAQNGNTAQIEQFARNYVASQGKDFDQEFNSFKQMLGI